MIHYEIPKPEISPRFDVDDIRALRIWSSMRLKDATIEEMKNDTAERAKSVSNKIDYVFDPAKNCSVHYPPK